jgi:asparagine synthase (glutamine-hydrolysing)
MSGIAGIYNLDGKPVERETGWMVGAMEHRGPDGIQTWKEGPVGLGHCMLETTPEDQYESFPLVDPIGNYVITADARIDNRDDLIEKLGLQKSRDRPTTDGELILEAFKQWGEKSPEYLIGAFAFIIYNYKEQALFCARDHIGVKPLYYSYREGEFFAVSTEIKSIFSIGKVDENINEEVLYGKLSNIRTDKEKTIYENILRVNPGNTCTASVDQLNVSSYWSLGNVKQKRERGRDYSEEFLDIFRKSVECRIRSSSPIATELSGGLDSTSVSCIVSELTDRSVHAISLLFELYEDCDESSYIKEVIKAKNITPHFESGERYSRLSEIEDILRYIDDGTVPVGSHHLVWQRAEMAADLGCRTLLTGYDGDSVVYHGFEYFGMLADEGNWSLLYDEMNTFINRLKEQRVKERDQLNTSSEEIAYEYIIPKLKDIARNARYLEFVKQSLKLSSEVEIGFLRILRMSLKSLLRSIPLLGKILNKKNENENPKKRTPILDKKFEERVKNSIKYESRGEFKSVRGAQRDILTSGRIGETLESLNYYAAAHQIEFRHPFMDKRLIEFCLSLPADQSFSNGWSRFILRKAMKNVIPESVRRRVGKTGFAQMTAAEFFKNDSNTILKTIDKSKTMSKYANTSVAKRIVQKGQTEGPQALSAVEVNQLNTLVTLSLKLERDQELQEGLGKSQ